MRNSIRHALAWTVAAGLTALVACDQPGDPTAAAAGPTSAPAPLPPGADGQVHLTDAQWRDRLTAEQFHILREQGTEPPFDNAYWNNHAAGLYRCAACGQVLFSSDQKFESGTGWPSFTAAVAQGRVELVPDADGERTEVECSRCGGHLGHLFDDGPAPTGQRYCMDSASLHFVPAAGATTRTTQK